MDVDAVVPTSRSLINMFDYIALLRIGRGLVDKNVLCVHLLGMSDICISFHTGKNVVKFV